MNRILVYLLSAYIIFFPFFRNSDTNEAWMFKAEISLIICGIALIFARTDWKTVPSRIFLPFSLFLLWAVFSGIISENPWYSIFPVLEILLPVLSGTVTGNLINSRQLKKLLLIQGWLLSAAVIMFHFHIPQAVSDFWTYGKIDFVSGINYENFFFYNRNFLAIHLFLLSLYLYLNGILLPAAVLLAISAFCRTKNIVFAALVLIISALIQKIAKIRHHYVFSAVVSVLILLFLILLPKFDSLPEVPSFEHRLLMWRTSLDIGSDNLLNGVGTGNLVYAFPVYYQKYLKINPDYNLTIFSHNDFLEIFAENGLIGLVLFLWFTCSLFSLELIPATIMLACVCLSFFTMARHTGSVIFFTAIAFSMNLSDTVRQHFPEKKVFFFRFLRISSGFILISTALVFMLSNSFFISGVKHSENMNTRTAISCFKKVLILRPFYVPALIYLADIYARDNQLDQAKQFIDRAALYEPFRPSVLYNSAGIMARLGMREKAIEKFTEYLKLDPQGVNGTDAEVSLGLLYLESGNLSSAEKHLAEAAVKMPDNPFIHLKLLEIYQKTNNPVKIAEYEKKLMLIEKKIRDSQEFQ